MACKPSVGEVGLFAHLNGQTKRIHVIEWFTNPWGQRRPRLAAALDASGTRWVFTGFVGFVSGRMTIDRVPVVLDAANLLLPAGEDECGSGLEEELAKFS